MNATVHTAHVLDQHRAADLVRTGELLRRHAERPAVAAADRPTGFSVVVAWVSAIVRRPHAPLAAH